MFRILYELIENRRIFVATPHIFVMLHLSLEQAGKMKEPDFVNKRIYVVLPTAMLQTLQYFYMVSTGRKDAETDCQVGCLFICL
jgi:hypothetical protein